MGKAQMMRAIGVDIAELCKDIGHGLNDMTRNGAFAKYGRAYIALEAPLFIIAAAFAIALTIENGGAFSPETWGAWACQFPAHGWAAVQFVGATITVAGLMQPSHRWAVATGALIQVLQFSALAYSATFTGGQFVIGIYNLLLFIPFHVMLIVGAYRHEP